MDLIRQWWRGEVSSRRVYNAIAALPADSATKTSIREGDWSERQYIDARVANELMCLRGDYASAHDAKTTPNLLESPQQRELREEALEVQHSLHDWMHAQMTGQHQMAPRGRGPMVIDEEKGGVA